MAVCTQCGQQNPGTFRFCGACAAQLTTPPPASEERKVVSILFCDLVGFTANSHAADPEDVSRDLAAYHSAARREIEHYGGVVEKFIGDAVVGVWGCPIAHEDDAERAVRAGLAIIDAVTFEVRVAVNTGEALVRIDPGADPGFGVVGDVVNTASRLQGVAPAGGIVVGHDTVQAAGAAMKFRALPPAQLKGKPHPVPVWQVVGTTGGPGQARDAATPFVGRATELALLAGMYERAADEPGLQLVSLVGEPGVGKSRLVIEFERWLSGQPVSAVVRRGRCLAYGDGVGYWPLAEIVKAQAGIGERDSESEAHAKLAAAVDGMPDAAWLRARLAPLVGLPGDAGEREQVFTAWRRFFEEVAIRSPLVLIVEDVHWADPAMLAFLRHLAEWSSGAPILLVCTARPELLDAHAGWGGDLVNASTIAVRPLKEAETKELAHLLLARFPGSSDPGVLADRCGGNPLYAEEYARLLADRIAEVDVAMPSSLQALIAARIDTLPPSHKALLQDAAVIGRVFWAGAASTIGELAAGDVRSALHDLTRKELIRASRASSMPGDEEFVFWHDLVHDVAYRSIPRSRRAQLHATTAAWIERAAGGRLADRAELIAHHYRQALELGAELHRVNAERLGVRLVHMLAIAAETALDIDPGHAARLTAEALARARDDDPSRARLLCAAGTAHIRLGRLDEANGLLTQARAAASQAGDWPLLGECYFQQLEAAFFAGEGETFDAVFTAALAELPRGPTTSGWAMTLTNGGFIAMQRGDHEAAAAIYEQAITAATETGDEIAIATALNNRGLFRSENGDRGAFEDLRRSHDMFAAAGSSWTTMAKFHLGYVTVLWDGPHAAKADLREAIDDGDRLRDPIYAMFARVEELFRMDVAGEWDDLLDLADEIIRWADSAGATQHGTLARCRKARILALRGRLDAAAHVTDGLLDRAREIGDLQALTPALVNQGLLAFLDGRPDTTSELLREINSRRIRSESPIGLIFRLLDACGDIGHAAEMVDHARRGAPRFELGLDAGRALLLEASGSLGAAYECYGHLADQWRAHGDPYELASALAGRARIMQALGHAAEAARVADESNRLFDRLGVVAPARLGASPRAHLGVNHTSSA